MTEDIKAAFRVTSTFCSALEKFLSATKSNSVIYNDTKNFPMQIKSNVQLSGRLRHECTPHRHELSHCGKSKATKVARSLLPRRSINPLGGRAERMRNVSSEHDRRHQSRLPSFLLPLFVFPSPISAPKLPLRGRGGNVFVPCGTQLEPQDHS